MERQVIDFHFWAWRSDHSQSLMYFSLLNETQIAVAHQHSEKSLLLRVIQRKHFVVIHVFQTELLPLLLRLDLFDLLLMIVYELQLVVASYYPNHPISRYFYDFFDSLLAIFRSLWKRVKKYLLVMLYNPPTRKFIVWWKCSPGGFREKLQKLSPLDSAASIDINFLEQTGELVMDELVGVVVIDCVTEQPDKLLEVDVIVVEDELLFDGVDALVFERHDHVAQVVAVRWIHHQLLLLTQVLQHNSQLYSLLFAIFHIAYYNSPTFQILYNSWSTSTPHSPLSSPTYALASI